MDLHLLLFELPTNTRYRKTMNPGRELDEMVAEKVMGYQRRATAPESWRYNDQNYSGIPSFSTSLEAAWEVVERINKQGHSALPFSKLWEKAMTIDSRQLAYEICLSALESLEMSKGWTP